MKALEFEDEELGKLLMDVCSDCLKAIVVHERVFHKLPDGSCGTEVLLGLGRNDPCFCGSGRKYKQCCMVKTLNLKYIV